MKFAAAAFATILAGAADAGCPYMGNGGKAPHPTSESATSSSTTNWIDSDQVWFKIPERSRRGLQVDNTDEDLAYSNQRVGDGGIPDGGYDAVREDIKALLTDSQSFWPGDFSDPTGPHYGGLFIRLAWHCNGSYRDSDGRGGCDGGNIRFDPVASWPDNYSLDMALQLLQPIKDNYGEQLSWGDLIVLAGDTSIEYMGGPIVGFCGGRIDELDGNESLPLGPSEIQQELMPCGEMCPEGQVCPGCGDDGNPLGASHMALIYVNPEGPDGAKGEVVASAQSIREVFGRMGFDDRLTVSIIGGGHAFGKCHGACVKTDVPGFCNETESWENKWTSGFEVQWTTIPTTWSNQFFTNLIDYNWTNITGPGGVIQWKPVEEDAPDIGMLTTDLALLLGDPEYEELSRSYAADRSLLEKDFGEAWYALMARDMGPRTRCLGDDLPDEVYSWEDNNLGPLTSPLPDYIPVRSMIQESIDNNPDNLSAFAGLAVSCSDSFRHTDYRGGCNGAAIRFSPQIDWSSNEGAAAALEELEPIKDAFPDVSYADLIVLAGQTAVEAAGGKPMSFCGGRVDADDGDKATGLEPRIWNNNTYASIVYNIDNKGMSLAEGVALLATPAAGSTELSNQYFVDLKANEPDSVYLQDELGAVVDEFINDNDYFLTEYAKAFNYMVTADLFDGPTKNACEGVDIATLEGETSDEESAGAVHGFAAASIMALVAALFAMI